VAPYSLVSLAREAEWILGDGVALRASDPVLELHIHGGRLCSALETGASWRDIIAEEFTTLTPMLSDRSETAIVGTTILRRQVVSFGASVRDAPAGFYVSLDAFYRKLILAAFHPAGARRALSERQPLVDAAISRRDFCQRFAKRERDPLPSPTKSSRQLGLGHP
jgi:hypothetical protein